MTFLDDWKVNGKPLGDCTGDDLISAAELEERKAALRKKVERPFTDW